jgi:hypothetical protein
MGMKETATFELEMDRILRKADKAASLALITKR